MISLAVRVCFAELAWHDLNLRVRRLAHDGRLWFLLTVRDETVQRQAEAALLRRTELEVLLERIQHRFVHTTVDDADVVALLGARGGRPLPRGRPGLRAGLRPRLTGPNR